MTRQMMIEETENGKDRLMQEHTTHGNGMYLVGTSTAHKCTWMSILHCQSVDCNGRVMHLINKEVVCGTDHNL